MSQYYFELQFLSALTDKLTCQIKMQMESDGKHASGDVYILWIAVDTPF